MFFWLVCFLIIVGIVMVILGNKCWNRPDVRKNLKDYLNHFFYYNDDSLCSIGSAVIIIAGIIFLIMIFGIIDTYSGLDAYIAQKNETYKAICFKVESEYARDEFGLLNKEIVDEVQTWNETIAYKKEIQDNFWVGIFYPNIYDEFELIDLDEFQNKQTSD